MYKFVASPHNIILNWSMTWDRVGFESMQFDNWVSRGRYDKDYIIPLASENMSETARINNINIDSQQGRDIVWGSHVRDKSDAVSNGPLQ